MAVTLDIAALRARREVPASALEALQAPVPPQPIDVAATKGDGLGCHSGKDVMRAAAEAAGMSETLDRLKADYPVGPHDQPQSMCPAFGSLRVGLRMRRTATILSGSACCVYGLTFTSHFYGAKRSVGYVPFNSETLVTGKLFEDIREAVFLTARPADYDAVVVINLCVPTASGVPLRLLPKEIDGVRIIGIDVPGFGVPTHAEAKDVLAGAMLQFARTEAEQGPVQAPRAGRSEQPDGDAARRDVPGRSGGDRRDAGAAGARRRPGRPDPRMARALRGARRRGGGGDPPVLHREHPRVRSSPAARSSAPRRWASTAPPTGSTGSARPAPCRAAWSRPPRTACCRRSAACSPPRRSRAGSRSRATRARSFWSARLLIESGADLRYVGTACPRTAWSEADRDWLEARGVQVQFRASLEDDLAAMQRVPAGPGHRHHAGGAEGQGGRARRPCTSPT